jgi:hypothetical protein
MREIEYDMKASVDNTNWVLANSSYLAKTESNNCFIIYLKDEQDIRTCGFNSSKYCNDHFPQFFSFFFHKYLKMFQLSKPSEKLFPLNLQFAANMAAGSAILF